MSLADEPGALGVHARVAEVFAAVDERRRAYLDELVKRGGTCRGCGAGVGDAAIRVHPGVCAPCYRRRHLRPDPALVAKLAELSEQVEEPEAPPVVKTFTRAPGDDEKPETPARPAEEEHMPKGVRSGGPCKGCGTKSTRCRDECPTRKPKVAPLRKPRAAKVDGDELLERRKSLIAELAKLDEQLRLWLAAKEDELERVREAVQGKAAKTHAVNG